MRHKNVYENPFKPFRLSSIGVVLILVYQHTIGRLLPKVCRFEPSCSEYARQAFIRFPFFKALWLSVTRLMKCGPWHPGGYDPVPHE